MCTISFEDLPIIKCFKWLMSPKSLKPAFEFINHLILLDGSSLTKKIFVKMEKFIMHSLSH